MNREHNEHKNNNLLRPAFDLAAPSLQGREAKYSSMIDLNMVNQKIGEMEQLHGGVSFSKEAIRAAASQLGIKELRISNLQQEV